MIDVSFRSSGRVNMATRIGEMLRRTSFHQHTLHPRLPHYAREKMAFDARTSSRCWQCRPSAWPFDPPIPGNQLPDHIFRDREGVGSPPIRNRYHQRPRISMVASRAPPHRDQIHSHTTRQSQSWRAEQQAAKRHAKL
jgi:hypothetical protein